MCQVTSNPSCVNDVCMDLEPWFCFSRWFENSIFSQKTNITNTNEFSIDVEEGVSYCFFVQAMIFSRKTNQNSPGSSTVCTEQWKSFLGGEWPWLSVPWEARLPPHQSQHVSLSFKHSEMSLGCLRMSFWILHSLWGHLGMISHCSLGHFPGHLQWARFYRVLSMQITDFRT
jgi:hypothetical protein